MPRVKLIIVQPHDQISNMLFTLDLLSQVLQQLLQIIIKVFFKSIDHSVIIVFHDRFFDVLRFQKDFLLSLLDGVHQVSVVIIVLL